MNTFARLLAAAILVTLLTPATWAQVERDTEDRETEDERVEREVVVERDGEAQRFRIEHDGEVEADAEGERVERRVIRFRTPDGEEQVFEFDGLNPHEMLGEMQPFLREGAFSFGGDFPFDGERALFFEHDGEPLGLRFRREMGGHRGASPETRREAARLEAEARSLAARAREGDAAAERELDGVLEALFEVRGQMRAEQADALAEHAEELRGEAAALRERIQERQARRRALVEERKRALLGESGSGW